MNALSAKRLDNPDILPFALYQLGGTGAFIDVETIFMRCYELAPERFGWRTQKLPNYKTLSKALRDLEGKMPDLLVKTPDGLGRQLSAEGIKWVRDNLPRFEALTARPGVNPPTRRPGQRMLNALRDSPVVQAFVEGEQPDLARHIVADLLMCSPDSPASVWRERLETFRSAAEDANRPELLKFLEYLKTVKSEWFEGRR